MALERYAKVVDGVVVAREFKDSPSSKVGSDGGPVWRPIVSIDVDNSTGPNTKVSIVETIEQARVLRTKTIEDKTAQEIADDDTAAKDAAVANFDQAYDPIGGLAKMVQEMRGLLMDHENRIQSIEQSKPITITKGAFNTLIKSHEKTFTDVQFKDKWKDKL